MFNLKSTAFSDLAFPASRLGEDILAVIASNDGLRMAEHNIGLIAASALDIHEVGIGGGDEPFQLVRISLVFVGWMQQIAIHC